ncbi:MAG: baeRF7 domain-containing protein [Anaerolineae bacterium]
MSLLSIEEIQALWEARNGWCISIYVPTIRKGSETGQNRIRVKNMLDEAEDRLIEAGVRRPEAKALLAPAKALEPDESFWNCQLDGMALFLSSDEMRVYRIPLHLEPMLAIGERFHIKPLLPLLSNDGRYFVLALSQHGARLLEGTRFSLAEVQDMPETLVEALRLDDFPAELQFHTQTAEPAARTGGRPAIFHGHGGGEGDAKRLILEYFNRIDEALQPLLADERAPLILAGVDYLHPIYREASSYKHILHEGIAGSPDDITEDDLQEKAWRIVEPEFSGMRRQMEGRFQQLKGEGSDLASDDLGVIVAAALYERVDTLFVATDAQHWGTFDREALQVVERDEPQPGDEDLLDLAAIHTLLNRGRVYADERTRLPGGGDAAALFRY